MFAGVAVQHWRPYDIFSPAPLRAIFPKFNLLSNAMYLQILKSYFEEFVVTHEENTDLINVWSPKLV